MNNKHLIHIFGEVLFDHFPDGSRVLGGAPFNVAWHLQALGQSPRFISRIGNDPEGQEIADLMDGWGMSRESLQIDCEHPTGSVRVRISGGEPHYEILPDSAYDFIDGDLLGNEPTEGILYHGSLAARNPVSRAALETVKKKHQGKIFIDVNLRAPWWQKESMLPLISDAHWVKLNESELAELCAEPARLETAMQAFCAQFGLDMLLVTRGEKGAAALDTRRQFVTVAPSASSSVIDTVGAGDAFAAVMLLGLSKNWPLPSTLERAQTFASAVVGQRGATVADKAFYRPFREQWGLADL
ncbi:MAG: carbohydrate kinase family protein [Gammaproteobacteria bacterium]